MIDTRPTDVRSPAAGTATVPSAAPASGASHRLGTALGAGLVVVLLGSAAPTLAADSGTATAVVTVAIALALAVAVGALVAGRERTLHRLDVAVLLLGLLGAAASRAPALFTRTPVYPSDEGRLGSLAIATLLGGGDPYARTFPSVAHFAGSTPLLGGGAADTFGYPPLSTDVGAVLGAVWRPLGQPGVVGALALAATATVLFLVLPRVLRAPSVAVLLAAGPFVTYAVNGHPVVLAVALLCAAAVRWPQVGATGRLGAGGIARAAALGLACAAQQLVWPAALAMVVAWWVVRRGDGERHREATPRRAAGAVLARYVSVSAVAFVVAAALFLVHDPDAFARRLAGQLTQQAVPGGQGLVALDVAVRGQAGALAWWTLAALALFAALLALLVTDRRMLSAAPALAPALWLLTPRSQVEYLVAFVPVVLVWAAAARPEVLVSARPWVVPAPRSVRRLGAAALLVPAVGCVAVALAVPGPLAMRVDAQQRTARGIVALTVTVHNRTGASVRPSFYVDDASHINAPWRAARGSTEIPAGATRTVLLRPALLGPAHWTSRLRVWALSDGPAAISSAAVPEVPASAAVPGAPASAAVPDSAGVAASGDVPSASGGHP